VKLDDVSARPGQLQRPIRLPFAIPWPLTARAAVAVLGLLAVLSAALRIYLAREVHGPFVFMDELDYEQMARSFARTGHFALLGKKGIAFSPLYPIVISPIYVATSSAQTAYEWTKALNAVLLSLSVFPVYAIARFVLSRPRALGVAALSLLAPLMFYAGLEMSESLAYPLCLVAIWAMLRALREPGLRNDALLVGAILLASAARLQLVVLVPAALTAVLLAALMRPDADGGRARELGRAIRRHRLLFGSSALGLLAVVVRTAVNGGALPLAGAYAGVSNARPGPLRVLELAFQHLAELDFAVGIVPFAGALVAAFALARFGFPRNAVAFASVALGVSGWLLLEVSYFAAAYDGKTASSQAAQAYTTTPRIHERYLIYLVPLFLVALVAGLRAVRPRVATPVHLAIAATVALLPAAIPFASVVNYTIVADTFGLQIFGTSVHGDLGAIPHAQQVAIGIAAVLALGYLYALLRPRPSFAIVITVVAFLMLSMLVRIRIHGTADKTYSAVPTHSAWVDRVTHGHDVALVGGSRTKPAPLLLTAFGNLTISRVYYTCRPLFGSAFGEERLAADARGVLRSPSGPVRASYAVVPANLPVRGRVLAREPKEGLVLVAPAGGELAVRGPVGCRG
jgi:hypothetical protein